MKTTKNLENKDKVIIIATALNFMLALSLLRVLGNNSSWKMKQSQKIHVKDGQQSTNTPCI